MHTLVHLSDLHFGAVCSALVDPLVQAVREMRPDLVAVSGDLTQRARKREFRLARAFLDTLPAPRIVVPGNHDIPLYNPVLRFLCPLARFRRFISGNLSPLFVNSGVAVLGASTARSFVAKGGRINIGQVQDICSVFDRLGGRVTKVVVTHHPFDLPEGFSNIHLVGRSRMAMENFARCGADLFLSGHLHKAHAGSTARYMIPGFSALVIEAGTAVSIRGRGELNSFNLIHIDGERITVETHAWRADDGRFSCFKKNGFRKTEEGWVPSK